MNFTDTKLKTLSFVLFLGMCPLLYAAGPLVEDMAEQGRWVSAKFEGKTAAKEESFSDEPPFSFTYDGKEFSQVRDSWETNRKSEKLDEFRIRHEITYRDPKTDLTVRCVGIAWQDFPTVEWTLYFKNEGSKDTPILENIQALDMDLSRVQSGEFLLHHAVGSPSAPNDFQPLESVLGPNATKRIAAAGGPPTYSDMSYFNLEFPNKHGIIVAVGWPGQWASSWVRDGGTGLRVVAGQELTHFKLLPGEEVRSPLIVLQFW